MMARILAIFITIGMCFTIGCHKASVTTEPGNISYPNIISDSYDGAYAVYQVFRSQSNVNEIYVQRISSSGSRLWGEKGVLVASIQRTFSNEPLIVLADDNGNAIVAWQDKHGITSLIRLNQEGHILRQKKIDEYIYSSQIVSDSAGGIIYMANDSVLKRVDAEGNPVWTKTTSTYDVNKVAGKFIISDGMGGAITYTLESNAEERTNIYIQRVDSDGNYYWKNDDTLLYSADKEIGDMSVSADGTGGAVVMWTESKWDWESPKYFYVRALRIDKDGVIRWQKNNEPLEVFQPGERLQSYVFGDGNGGAFVFGFGPNGQAISAQRISPEGGFLWNEFDCSTYEGNAQSLAYKVIPDGGGGVILTRCLWEGVIDRYLVAQRLDQNGNSLYPQGEVRLSDDLLVNPFFFQMAPDGNNGALIAWGSSQDLHSIEHSSVQRINAEGELVWGDSGIKLDDWNSSVTVGRPTMFFPIQKKPDPNYIYPTALFEGKLVLDNNSLRLKAFWSTSDLLIWPYGYSPRIVDKQIQVIDNDGQLVGRLGDKIKVGGGEVPSEIIEKYIGQELPDDSEGPYWLVSHVIDNK
jgi:hypothetical protein